MLSFVGLGLYDERSITLRGQAALREADAVFAEFYTSRLVGTTVEELAAFHGIDIEVRSRDGVETDPEPILAAATDGDAVFLTAGDPMVSTTHIDLRLRAHDRSVRTRVIHGTTAQTAASSVTGLQNYRFGKATTLPFPNTHAGEEVPASVRETITANRERALHTLVYLDIDAATERYMDGATAASQLAGAGLADRLGVVVARAGSDDPSIVADRLDRLATQSFGGPLHLLVLPATLHAMEAQALQAFGDAPPTAIDGP